MSTFDKNYILCSHWRRWTTAAVHCVSHKPHHHAQTGRILIIQMSPPQPHHSNITLTFTVPTSLSHSASLSHSLSKHHPTPSPSQHHTHTLTIQTSPSHPPSQHPLTPSPSPSQSQHPLTPSPPNITLTTCLLTVFRPAVSPGLFC